MTVGWWFRSVDEAAQMMIPVSWWCYLVDDLVIDNSLLKQGKANQGKGLFCTSSRTNEVPFIAHELVQHLPTAQCSFSKHEHDHPTRGDKEIGGQGWYQSVDDAGQLMMPMQKIPLSWFALPCLCNESSITFKCNCTPTLIYCCLTSTISANHIVEIGIVIDTGLLMMLVGWWGQLVDDPCQMGKLVSWWCQSVDDAILLIMLVGCWCWLIEDDILSIVLIISLCWSVDNVSPLMMPASWWCQMFDAAGFLMILVSW